MLARSGLAMHPSVFQWGDCFWPGGANFGSQNQSGETNFGCQNWFGDYFFTKIGPGDNFWGGDRFWCDRPIDR